MLPYLRLCSCDGQHVPTSFHWLGQNFVFLTLNFFFTWFCLHVTFLGCPGFFRQFRAAAPQVGFFFWGDFGRGLPFSIPSFYNNPTCDEVRVFEVVTGGIKRDPVTCDAAGSLYTTPSQYTTKNLYTQLNFSTQLKFNTQLNFCIHSSNTQKKKKSF